jgi:hypothetical protein
MTEDETRPPVLNEMPDWARYLMTHRIETSEERRQFERDFPDAPGEVILMNILKRAGMLGL